MIFLALYLLFVALALWLAVFVYRRLRPRGTLLASSGGLLAVAAFSLFLPIPIHGSFTFPLEILWQELQSAQWRQESRRQDEKQHAFKPSLQQRFAGVLEGYTVMSEEGGWKSVRLRGAQVAWLDSESALLWLPPQGLASGAGLLDLETASRFCQHQPPRGYWALPSEAELALLWQHGGHRFMPGTGQSSIALLADGALSLQLATHYRGRVAGHAVRCTALTEGAPRHGYMSDDLPLSLWNSYQLSKADIYAVPLSVEGQTGVADQ